MSFLKNQNQIFSQESLNSKLQLNRQLIIKYGIDATGDFLHLGHAVNLWMLREFQELGHKVVIILGDFTTAIGDPTGKSESRPMLNTSNILNKCHSIRQQLKLILLQDSHLLDIKYNSDWYNKFQLSDFISILLSQVTHSRLISRDMFQERIYNEKEIRMSELIYPLLQGWDSVVVRSDVTICGSDQLFNEMLGKFYQEKQGQEPQVIITSKITTGLCGINKQSKSLNNYIGLLDTPKDKFGKAMTLADNQIKEWIEVYTDLENFISSNSYEDKLLLAYELVKKYHGTQIAIEEKDWWLHTFSNKTFPEDAPILEVPNPSTLLEILKYVYPDNSNTQLKNLVKEGAIKIEGIKCKDIYKPYNVPFNLQAGKHIFLRIVFLWG